LLVIAVQRIGRNVGSAQEQRSDGQGGVQWFIVAPLWLSVFFLSAALCMVSSKPPLAGIRSYSGYLFSFGAWPWAWPPLGSTGLGLWILAYYSQKNPSKVFRVITGFWIAVGGLLVLYLEFCGILLLLHN